MPSERPLTEKQRVALPIALWLSLVGMIITCAGAWFTTRAEAASAASGSRENAVELREHDRRIQRLEDTQTFTREMLEKIYRKLERGREQ